MITDKHGKGALRHPNYDKRVILGAAHIQVGAADFSNPTGLLEPPDEEQGSSQSCTSQAHGYYLWQLTNGQQLWRNDIYSHTFLPGGGAYLTSPSQFDLGTGPILRSDANQEPNPETEETMEKVVATVDDKGRIHQWSYTPITLTIDFNLIGSVLEKYKGCIIGIDGNQAGWTDEANPTYNAPAEWGHALYVYDRAIAKQLPTLKAKSSWCSTGIPNHFLPKSYFDNGGCFEVLVYANFKEITSPMKIVNDNGTFWIVGELGKIGIADPATLAQFQKVTAEVSVGSTVNVPSVGTMKESSVLSTT